MFLNQAYKKEVKYLRLKIWTFCSFNLFQKNNRKRDKTMNNEKKITNIYNKEEVLGRTNYKEDTIRDGLLLQLYDLIRKDNLINYNNNQELLELKRKNLKIELEEINIKSKK